MTWDLSWEEMRDGADVGRSVLRPYEKRRRRKAAPQVEERERCRHIFGEKSRGVGRSGARG